MLNEEHVPSPEKTLEQRTHEINAKIFEYIKKREEKKQLQIVSLKRENGRIVTRDFVNFRTSQSVLGILDNPGEITIKPGSFFFVRIKNMESIDQDNVQEVQLELVQEVDAKKNADLIYHAEKSYAPVSKIQPLETFLLKQSTKNPNEVVGNKGVQRGKISFIERGSSFIPKKDTWCVGKVTSDGEKVCKFIPLFSVENYAYVDIEFPHPNQGIDLFTKPKIMLKEAIGTRSISYSDEEIKIETREDLAKLDNTNYKVPEADKDFIREIYKVYFDLVDESKKKKEQVRKSEEEQLVADWNECYTNEKSFNYEERPSFMYDSQTLVRMLEEHQGITIQSIKDGFDWARPRLKLLSQDSEVAFEKFRKYKPMNVSINGQYIIANFVYTPVLTFYADIHDEDWGLHKNDSTGTTFYNLAYDYSSHELKPTEEFLELPKNVQTLIEELIIKKGLRDCQTKISRTDFHSPIIAEYIPNNELDKKFEEFSKLTLIERKTLLSSKEEDKKIDKKLLAEHELYAHKSFEELQKTFPIENFCTMEGDSSLRWFGLPVKVAPSKTKIERRWGIDYESDYTNLVYSIDSDIYLSNSRLSQWIDSHKDYFSKLEIVTKEKELPEAKKHKFEEINNPKPKYGNEYQDEIQKELPFVPLVMADYYPGIAEDAIDSVVLEQQEEPSNEPEFDYKNLLEDPEYLEQVVVEREIEQLARKKESVTPEEKEMFTSYTHKIHYIKNEYTQTKKRIKWKNELVEELGIDCYYDEFDSNDYKDSGNSVKEKIMKFNAYYRKLDNITDKPKIQVRETPLEIRKYLFVKRLTDLWSEIKPEYEKLEQKKNEHFEKLIVQIKDYFVEMQKKVSIMKENGKEIGPYETFKLFYKIKNDPLPTEAKEYFKFYISQKGDNPLRFERSQEVVVDTLDKELLHYSYYSEPDDFYKQGVALEIELFSPEFDKEVEKYSHKQVDIPAVDEKVEDVSGGIPPDQEEGYSDEPLEVQPPEVELSPEDEYKEALDEYEDAEGAMQKTLAKAKLLMALAKLIGVEQDFEKKSELQRKYDELEKTKKFK